MKKLLIILSILLLLTLALLSYLHFNTKQESKSRVIFFDIGQGDSALIQFKNDSKMLVDCGVDKKILAKLGKYLPFYDRTIDYLLVTHPDLDHYGGCIDVLKRYKVKNIITNGEKKEYDKYWLAWAQAVRLENANEVVIARTSTWKISSSTLEFLWPDKEGSKSGNSKSIVFRLVNSQTSIMFTGDIEEEVEDLLVEEYCNFSSSSIKQVCPKLESKMLKVSHHGSDSSTGVKFLQAVNPNKAIISVGHNSFGHPSLRILRRLERISAEILRTDKIGDLLFF